VERLYRVLGFMYVPPKPKICCIWVIEKQYPRLLQEVGDMNVEIDLSEYYINNIGKIVRILSSILTE
jgi:hypothetical protein